MKKLVRFVLIAAFSGAILLLLGSGYAADRSSADVETFAVACAASEIASEMGSSAAQWQQLAQDDPAYFFQLSAE